MRPRRIGAIAVATWMSLSGSPAGALTDDEFNAAVATGRSALSIDSVPEFLVAGTQTLDRKGRGRGYMFLIGTCRQYVPHAVFSASIDGHEAHANLLKPDCLDHDLTRVLVTPLAYDNAIVPAGSHVYLPPEQRITGLAILADGKPVAPLADPRSNTAGYAFFPTAALMGAKDVSIVAKIGSSVQLEQKIPKKMLKPLLGR